MRTSINTFRPKCRNLKFRSVQSKIIPNGWIFWQYEMKCFPIPATIMLRNISSISAGTKQKSKLCNRVSLLYSHSKVLMLKFFFPWTGNIKIFSCFFFVFLASFMLNRGCFPFTCKILIIMVQLETEDYFLFIESFRNRNKLLGPVQQQSITKKKIPDKLTKNWKQR